MFFRGYPENGGGKTPRLVAFPDLFVALWPYRRTNGFEQHFPVIVGGAFLILHGFPWSWWR